MVQMTQRLLELEHRSHAARGAPVIAAMDSALPRRRPLSRKASVTKGALMMLLQPRLASDAKVDLDEALQGVTNENFASKKDAIARGVDRATRGKLRPGADTRGVRPVLDALEPINEPEATDDLMESDRDELPTLTPKELELVLANMSPEDRAEFFSLLPSYPGYNGGTASPDNDERDDEEAEDEEADNLNPRGSDRKRAMDSFASRFPNAARLKGSAPVRERERMALDSKAVDDFARRFPNVARIKPSW